MRLIKFPLLASLLFVNNFCFAQKQNVYFLKNNGRYIDLRDSADYIRVVREPDSASALYNVFEYYTSGKLKFMGKSIAIDPPVLEGQGLSYYPCGVKKLLATYERNRLTGTSVEYYPNGKMFVIKEYKKENPGDKTTDHTKPDYLITASADSTGKATVTDGTGYYIGYNGDFKSVYEEGAVKNGENEGDWTGFDNRLKAHFTEHYENSKLISGVSTDSAGVTHQYQSRTVEPSFKGGIENFYKYLMRTMHYPDNAKEKGIQGKVFISFVIKKDGQLKDIKVLRPVSPELDEEALRVIRLSPDWIPGMVLGMVANVQYTIPLNFAISES